MPATGPSRATVMKTLRLMGTTIEVLTSPNTTGTDETVVDYHMPPHFPGPIPHWHAKATEWFYVTEGEVTVEAAGKQSVLRQGEFLLVPPRTVHKFSNPGEAPARMLVGFNPGRLDEYFTELFKMIRDSMEWPPKDPRPVEELAERYDTYSPAKLSS